MADDPLDEIFSDAPVTAPVVETTTAETTTGMTTEPVQDTTQPRDEQGKFAPKASETEPTSTAEITEPDKGKPPPGFVPIAVVQETRSKVGALEQQIATLTAALAQRQQPPAPVQEKAKPKDFWEDPDQFTEERVTAALNPVQNMVRGLIFNNSVREATREFGDEKINAAQDAIKQAIATGQLDGESVKAQLSQSFDPVGDVVRWHQKQAALQRVGTDPDAWLKTEIERLKGDPAFQAEIIERARSAASTQTTGRPAPVTLPPSLNRISGPGNEVIEGDTSSEGLFNHALAGR